MSPVPTSGMEMIAPSGKFWMAMPMASANAPAVEISALPESMPASTTPTAMPSGRLCSATASTSILDLPRPQWQPSGQSESMCMWGMSVSSNSRKPMPARKPTAAGSQAMPPEASAISMDGISSDHTEAAIITPDAKPSSAF